MLTIIIIILILILITPKYFSRLCHSLAKPRYQPASKFQQPLKRMGRLLGQPHALLNGTTVFYFNMCSVLFKATPNKGSQNKTTWPSPVLAVKALQVGQPESAGQKILYQKGSSKNPPLLKSRVCKARIQISLHGHSLSKRSEDMAQLNEPPACWILRSGSPPQGLFNTGSVTQTSTLSTSNSPESSG